MKILLDKKGQSFIDMVPLMIICVMVILSVIGVHAFISERQNLSYFAGELLNTACGDGRIAGNITNAYENLEEITGISPVVEWDTTYHNSGLRTVQRGETITVTLRYTARLRLFSDVGTNVPMRVTKSGKSEVFYK